MKLIIVDPFITKKSPSMRSIVDSLDVILDIFSEVEVFATECEWTNPKVTIHKIPQRFKQWAFHSLDFNRKVNRLGIGSRQHQDEIVQVTGCITPKADIRYIHFWNEALLKEVASRPTFKLPPHKLLSSQLAARTERKTAKDPESTGAWWVVSRSIAEKIKHDANAHGEFRILPNVYDRDRFHSSVRTRWRAKYRKHYGISSKERLLVFSAFGHFERKGLLEAIQAISIMRKKGHSVRLLILGGTPATVESFKKKISHISDGIIFAGLVSEIERHLSAADGFFFPSHFEAFSLAEIESAALGLPLYLTPHFGHEMILREPVNGRLLPWQSEGMAETLIQDFSNRAIGASHNELGEAVDTEGYRKLIHRFYLESVNNKR